MIPFSVTQTPLRPVIHNASFLHVGVPVWEIRDAGGATNMLVRDGKLGQSLAAALGDKPVALMRGHGNVVVGPNVRVATARAIFTDENARMQYASDEDRSWSTSSLGRCQLAISNILAVVGHFEHSGRSLLSPNRTARAPGAAANKRFRSSKYRVIATLAAAVVA